MVVFVATGFSRRRPGETPVPPRKVGRKIFDWAQPGIIDTKRTSESGGPGIAG
jgi:hypothetical protein